MTENVFINTYLILNLSIHTIIYKPIVSTKKNKMNSHGLNKIHPTYSKNKTSNPFTNKYSFDTIQEMDEQENIDPNISCKNPVLYMKKNFIKNKNSKKNENPFQKTPDDSISHNICNISNSSINSNNSNNTNNTNYKRNSYEQVEKKYQKNDPEKTLIHNLINTKLHLRKIKNKEYLKKLKLEKDGEILIQNSIDMNKIYTTKIQNCFSLELGNLNLNKNFVLLVGKMKNVSLYETLDFIIECFTYSNNIDEILFCLKLFLMDYKNYMMLLSQEFLADNNSNSKNCEDFDTCNISDCSNNSNWSEESTIINNKVCLNKSLSSYEAIIVKTNNTSSYSNEIEEEIIDELDKKNIYKNERFYLLVDIIISKLINLSIYAYNTKANNNINKDNLTSKRNYWNKNNTNSTNNEVSDLQQQSYSINKTLLYNSILSLSYLIKKLFSEGYYESNKNKTCINSYYSRIVKLITKKSDYLIFYINLILVNNNKELDLYEEYLFIKITLILISDIIELINTEEEVNKIKELKEFCSLNCYLINTFCFLRFNSNKETSKEVYYINKWLNDYYYDYYFKEMLDKKLNYKSNTSNQNYHLSANIVLFSYEDLLILNNFSFLFKSRIYDFINNYDLNNDESYKGDIIVEFNCYSRIIQSFCMLNRKNKEEIIEDFRYRINSSDSNFSNNLSFNETKYNNEQIIKNYLDFCFFLIMRSCKSGLLVILEEVFNSIETLFRKDLMMSAIIKEITDNNRISYYSSFDVNNIKCQLDLLLASSNKIISLIIRYFTNILEINTLIINSNNNKFFELINDFLLKVINKRLSFISSFAHRKYKDEMILAIKALILLLEKKDLSSNSSFIDYIKQNGNIVLLYRQLRDKKNCLLYSSEDNLKVNMNINNAKIDNEDHSNFELLLNKLSFILNQNEDNE